LENPETSGYLKKYLGINADVTTENRMRGFQYAQKLCGFFHVNITIHVEGFLAAQKKMLHAVADWDRYRALAKGAAGIETEHPAVGDLPEIGHK